MKIPQLSSEKLYNSFVENGVSYFCGVPDSLVSHFSLFLESNAKVRHTIAANEGNAIGLAIGYHVATNKIPLVYMQNSGLGNALDPLVSLADASVLSIPMFLLISWRGQPGNQDEPQHGKQGAITTLLLEIMGIPYEILSRKQNEAERQIIKASKQIIKTNKPHALLIQTDTFADFGYAVQRQKDYPLSREEAIKIVIEGLADIDVVVSSIGKLSRELFELRGEKRQGHQKDLLIVGGMGHASSIAMAIAEQKPDRKVYCLDGDGSVLMHMGSLATIGSRTPRNFFHVVFNNGLHDSVGGQPTAGFDVDIPGIARACGYSQAISACEPDKIQNALKKLRHLDGPVMLEIRVHSGARSTLTRPTILPLNNKKAFTKFLGKTHTS